MREVEDQIRHLADALFEATGPVVFTPPPERERSQPTLYLAIAAALICVLGIGGLIVSATLRNNDSTEVDVLWVSDPLSINLDDAIEKSEQQRIASIGPLLTFDFGSLPTGWEASTNFTATTGEGDRAEYWQQVLVTSPDRVKLAVNVNGRLDQGVMLPPDNVDDQRGEPIDVRGQPGLQTLTSVSWIEQDRVRVDIVSRGASGLPDISADLSALARLLEPIRAQLDWSNQPRIGRQFANVEPLLAGNLAGIAWKLVPGSSGLVIAAGTDYIATSDGSPPLDDDFRIKYSYEAISIPGGSIVSGDAPVSVRRVQLRTANTITELPIAPLPQGRVAFAVPIDDRLDPISIDFLDDNGEQLASIPMDQRPPYQGGSGSSSVSL